MTLSANPRGEDSAGGCCGNSGGEEDRRTTITEGLQPRNEVKGAIVLKETRKE